MIRRITTLMTIVSAGLLGACNGTSENGPAANEGAERVFTGGTIHTGLGTVVEAVAVRDGRIVYAGDAAGLDAFTGNGTEMVDLAGATMFPGFTDSHAHLIGIGQRERTLNLEQTASISDLQARVAAYAETNTQGVVFGRGWIETHWPEARFPNAADLDAVVADRPVILIRADGHALVANSAAIDAAGVTDETLIPMAGRFCAMRRAGRPA